MVLVTNFFDELKQPSKSLCCVGSCATVSSGRRVPRPGPDPRIRFRRARARPRVRVRPEPRRVGSHPFLHSEGPPGGMPSRHFQPLVLRKNSQRQPHQPHLSRPYPFPDPISRTLAPRRAFDFPIPDHSPWETSSPCRRGKGRTRPPAVHVKHLVARLEVHQDVQSEPVEEGKEGGTGTEGGGRRARGSRWWSPLFYLTRRTHPNQHRGRGPRAVCW